MNKVKFIVDMDGVLPYVEIPPGPRSKHKLSKCQSTRPESPLEKFHELLAHYANGGMAPMLADTLTLGGTAEYNVKRRYRAAINKARLEGEDLNIPVGYQDAPWFFDHSFLEVLNN